MEVERDRAVPVREIRQLGLEVPQPRHHPVQEHQRLAVAAVLVVEAGPLQ